MVLQATKTHNERHAKNTAFFCEFRHFVGMKRDPSCIVRSSGYAITMENEN